MATLIYSHPASLAHETPAGHPERIDRIRTVHQVIRSPHFKATIHREAPLGTEEQILRAHTEEHYQRILAAAPEHGFEYLDADTPMSPGSLAAALRAVGGTCAAVDAVLANDADNAFIAMRPPGHHAEANRAMGFCLFNHAAIAALHARAAHGLERIAVVDFDVHHGNGTQAIFEHDPRVLYLSSHQSSLYPLTGLESETGVGNIINATLAPRAGSEEFRTAWSRTLLPAMEAFSPQLVLVSAGFDGHRLDPLADLQLEAPDYHWLGGQIAAHARRYAAGRVACMLEGGYSLTALRECSVALVRGLQTGAAALA